MTTIAETADQMRATADALEEAADESQKLVKAVHDHHNRRHFPHGWACCPDPLCQAALEHER